MKKALFVILLITSISVWKIYQLFFEQETRNPHSIIQQVYGIEIPNSVKVNHFEENWNLTGNGYVYIDFDNIDKQQIQLVVNQCQTKKYYSLPMNDIITFGAAIVSNGVKSINASTGYYYATGSSLEKHVFIIDTINNKIYVYYNIN
jgi:hypothetical protein